MTSSTLATFSEKFPTDKPCTLWQAVQTNKTHSDPSEKQAVARAMVKDLLKSYAHDYLNAYFGQVETLYPGRPFAAYSIMLLSNAPKFAKRASKKRSKTVLGWVHTFLTDAGETELLEAFDEAIAHRLH